MVVLVCFVFVCAQYGMIHEWKLENNLAASVLSFYVSPGDETEAVSVESKHPSHGSLVLFLLLFRRNITINSCQKH